MLLQRLAAAGCKRCLDRALNGMISCHTTMPKAKVALTLDADLLDRVDELVARHRFKNRSQAVESALAEKLARLARTRLAEECAKLDPAEERRLADEGMASTAESWPEY
jgi:Arc/MetJ-type ribon-helix-helix transcriptional regulator